MEIYGYWNNCGMDNYEYIYNCIYKCIFYSRFVLDCSFVYYYHSIILFQTKQSGIVLYRLISPDWTTDQILKINRKLFRFVDTFFKFMVK